MNLPLGWADWSAFQARLGERFIAWAEPAPERTDENRYAVIIDNQSVVWARVSPNPDVRYDRSSGAFYDDMPGGAVEAAKRAAMLHKETVRALVDGGKP